MMAAKLPRVLSLFDFSTMSSASMGPAYSLASTMGPMVAVAGLGAPVSLIFVTFFMGCIAWAYHELSARYPAAGSAYSWVHRAFGPRAGAFIAWILIIANIFAVLATAIPAGTYTLDLLAPSLTDSSLAVSLVSALWVVASGLLLAAGIRPTVGVTAVLLGAEVIVLAASAIASMHLPAHIGGGRPFQMVAPSGLIGAMVLGIWMVDGWELSAATSEEAQHHGAAGRGGMVALGCMSLTLFVSMTAYLRLLGPAAFTGREADAMTVVGATLGGWWRPLIVLTVLVSTSATLWTTILYLTRSLYAMGRDGVLWRSFGGLHSDATPRRALLLVSIVGSIVTLCSGISPSVAFALTLAVTGSGVFLGLLFLGSAFAALKLVPSTPTRLVTLIGILGTAGGIAAQFADPSQAALRWSSGIGILLGIPFTLWRGRGERSLHGRAGTPQVADGDAPFLAKERH
jgi:amino acid transporter